MSLIRRHRVLSFVVGVVLALATGAAAALIVYDLTATGTVTGSSITITQTHAGALTYGNGAAAPALDSNAQVLVPVKLTNADPNNAHVVGPGLTITVADDQQPATCNSFLSHPAISSNLISPTSVPAGSFVSGTVTIALGNAPVACSGTTYTVTFSGVASS